MPQSSLHEKVLLPVAIFEVLNSSSGETEESLPQVEEWKVYPYLRMGSLEDLLVDYFRSERRTE